MTVRDYSVRIMRKVCLCVLLVASIVPSYAVMQTDSVADSKRKPTLKQYVATADSLRLRVRHAADNGYMLQWADSIVRGKRLGVGADSARVRRRHEKLAKVDGSLLKVDRLLARRYGKITYDTLYMMRPPYRWTVKVMANFSGATVTTRTRGSDDVLHEARVMSDFRGTLSIGATYRGLGLSVAVNPTKWVGKNKDYEFNLNSYSNKYGFDVIYFASNTYKGRLLVGDKRVDIDKGLVSQKGLNLNFYYAFSGKCFSFPAAFSQSYVQKKSAGSVMIGASFDGSFTDINADEEAGIKATKIKMLGFAIGAGYGYNYVAGKHWLFHLSALPTFHTYIHANTTVDGDKNTLRYKFPSIILTGRGAVVYSWKNKFASATAVYNFSVSGDEARLQLLREKFRVRCSYGFRF